MPQSKWTDKDERQYKKITRNQQNRGMKKSRANEIAARTVNKRRRKEGRTENAISRGTGNPRSSLEDRSKNELYSRAKQRHISGRSKMTKQELIDALRHS